MKDWLMAQLASVSIADWIKFAGYVITVVTFGLMALRQWAIRNKHLALVAFTDAARRAVGRINSALMSLPPGADKAAVKRTMMTTAVTFLLTEMADSANRIGATPDKTVAILEGEYGALPSPVVVPPSASGASPAMIAHNNVVTEANTNA